MLPVEDLPAIDLPSRSSMGAVTQTSHLSLSRQLREQTADLHREVEQKLGLPETITTLAEYTKLLERFYRLYRPLEISFGKFAGWINIGIDPSECVHSRRLAADLEALGIAPLDLLDAPESSQPNVADFAHAFGAMYVVEGSALGSQFILPHLVSVLGRQIEHADSFFRGRGRGTGAFWSAFRASLDRYGAEHSNEKADVVSGARSAFNAIGAWMQ